MSAFAIVPYCVTSKGLELQAEEVHEFDTWRKIDLPPTMLDGIELYSKWQSDHRAVGQDFRAYRIHGPSMPHQNKPDLRSSRTLHNVDITTQKISQERESSAELVFIRAFTWIGYRSKRMNLFPRLIDFSTNLKQLRLFAGFLISRFQVRRYRWLLFEMLLPGKWNPRRQLWDDYGLALQNICPTSCTEKYLP